MDERRVVDSDVPARLDRLRWSRFHWLVVFALGITWILDGLEVTLAGAVAPALKASPALHLTDAQVGAGASAYLAGAVLGAIFFGWLTDVLGRKRLFFITLGVYLVFTAATAAAYSFAAYAAFRCLTGAGIGGEYAAINSAIQELVPPRYRGRTDLAINGSFWVGAALGSLGSSVLLTPGLLPADIGWRCAFGIGALIGLTVLVFRTALPESPRWLLLHGRTDEAEQIVASIESKAGVVAGAPPPKRLKLMVRAHATNLVDLGVSLFRQYPRRAVLGLVLMASQAFCYNAIFFTYALVLDRFFHVPGERVGWYLLPFSITNFLGPLALGWLFDHWGRRPMISGSYAVTAVLLALTAWFFEHGSASAVSMTVAFSCVFFFASAAASSAYLTVSESFPVEVRALAIAVFYAFGTALGGIAAPWVFGTLIGTGDPQAIGGGYFFGAALMGIAAIIEVWLGVAAERRSLEEVARPLSSV